MVKEFRQKKGLSSRIYTLHDDKITIETKTPHAASKFDVKLTSLGFELHYHRVKALDLKFVYVLCSIFVGCTAALIIFNKATQYHDGLLFFCFIIILITIFESVKKRTDEIYLTGGQKTISFFRASPNEKTVLAFIDQVRQTTKQLLKIKYSSFDSSTTTEEYEARLKWLKEIEAIDADEYESLKQDFEIRKLID